MCTHTPTPRVLLQYHTLAVQSLFRLSLNLVIIYEGHTTTIHIYIEMPYIESTSEDARHRHQHFVGLCYTKTKSNRKGIAMTTIPLLYMLYRPQEVARQPTASHRRAAISYQPPPSICHLPLTVLTLHPRKNLPRTRCGRIQPTFHQVHTAARPRACAKRWHMEKCVQAHVPLPSGGARAPA